MSEVNIQTSTRQGIYRLIKVLKAELANELSLLNDTLNDINIPDEKLYFVSGTEAEMNSILSASQCACFIYQVGPSTFTASRTGDGNKRARLQTTIYRIVYLFDKNGAWNTYSADGDRGVNLTELTYHQADRIAGAATMVLYKHAVNETDIHEINVVSLDASVVAPNNDSLMGRAVIEVEVMQDVLVPMPAYTIT